MNVGVVFTIILTVIVIIMVLIFGSKQIIELLDLSGSALIKKTVNDLTVTTDRVYTMSEGSVLDYQASLPGNTKFCFVDPDRPDDTLDPTPSRRWQSDEVVRAIIEENRYNIWVETATEKRGYRIYNLVPLENFCIKSGTTLFLENRGLHVGIIDDSNS